MYVKALCKQIYFLALTEESQAYSLHMVWFTAGEERVLFENSFH